MASHHYKLTNMDTNYSSVALARKLIIVVRYIFMGPFIGGFFLWGGYRVLLMCANIMVFTHSAIGSRI